MRKMKKKIWETSTSGERGSIWRWYGKLMVVSLGEAETGGNKRAEVEGKLAMGKELEIREAV